MQAVVKTYSQFRWLHYWVVKLILGLVSVTLTNQLEGDIKELVTLFRKSGVHQWGTQSSRLWDKGGGTVSKKIISALWASVWSKNKGGSRSATVQRPWCHGLIRPEERWDQRWAKEDAYCVLTRWHPISPLWSLGNTTKLFSLFCSGGVGGGMSVSRF